MPRTTQPYPKGTRLVAVQDIPGITEKWGGTIPAGTVLEFVQCFANGLHELLWQHPTGRVQVQVTNPTHLRVAKYPAVTNLHLPDPEHAMAYNQMRNAWNAGERLKALRMAARWPRLGDATDYIKRAASCSLTPHTYAEMGQDPGTIMATGYLALQARYGLGD